MMIAYHYSPHKNRDSILKHGLLVPTKHPKLVEPVVCSEGHRNPHISLGRNPVAAWALSGGFLLSTHRPMPDLYWDLWQVYLGVRKWHGHEGTRWVSNGTELQVRQDIPRRDVVFVGSRYAE